MIRGVLAAVAAAALAALPLAPALAQAPTVLTATVDGPITPPVADYLVDGVERAAGDGHEAFVVILDTPGGLDTSMRRIIQSFLASEVPVIVYVSPPGARAASAGAFITMAGHVAAMAPGTNIGAATPVDLQGGEIGEKVLQDASAYARALAELRDRDEEFAVDAVREGRSEPASVALEIGVIDLVAASLPELLAEVDGRTVELDDERTVTLQTADASPVEHDLGFLRGIQIRLADPNLAFLFMSIGTLAIIYELANPGMGFGGIIGMILLVLAFFGLAVLPVNVVGVLLLLLALALFVAELFVPGVGVFAAGGAVSLVLSGVFLFRGGGDFGVDLIVILPTAVVVAGGTILAGRLVWRARARASATGEGMVVGRQAEVRHVEGTRGQIAIDGTWWRVRSDGGPLAEGRTVKVVAMEGLELLVEVQEEAHG